MSMSDPLGDMLTRIRNAQSARQSRCKAPASKLRENVLEVLKREPRNNPEKSKPKKKAQERAAAKAKAAEDAAAAAAGGDA